MEMRMEIETRTNHELAGRLLRFGLQPKLRPAQSTEYRELVERYQARADFRGDVRAMAKGLGLRILRADDYGLILVSSASSPFAFDPSGYRSSGLADDRLLDGLAWLGILTTVFPRAEDLQEDEDFSPRPITVEEVDNTVRRIADVLKSRYREEEKLEDPTRDDVEQGLRDAWRVYDERVATGKSGGSRSSSRSTQRKIEQAFDFFVDRGLFMRHAEEDRPDRYRATYRFKAMVEDATASRAYRALQDIQEEIAGHATPDATDAPETASTSPRPQHQGD